MARPKSSIGRNTRALLEATPAFIASRFIKTLLEDIPTAEPSQFENATDEEMQSRLPLDCLSGFHKEIRDVVEQESTKITELSQKRGPSSLDSIVRQTGTPDTVCEFDAQKDEFCRSVWTYLERPSLFQNGLSFHYARRDRNKGNVHSLFSLGDETATIDAAGIEPQRLANALKAKLDMPETPDLSIFDLEPTARHPASVMIISRRGDALTAVYEHRQGMRRSIYYRPENEITLIYTPSQQILEVCGKRFSVRHISANAFAEAVFGRNVTTHPLSEKIFDLGRFAESFLLDLPNVEGGEVQSAVVTEFELLLGDYRRRLNLSVAQEDDISAVADRCLNLAAGIRNFESFNKVRIAVEFQPDDAFKSKRIDILVRGTNGTNIQSHPDPEIRDLGLKLLEHWGMIRQVKLMTPQKAVELLDGMVRLFEFGEPKVSGLQLDRMGLNVTALQDAGLITCKSRQPTTLMDEDDAVIELDIEEGSGETVEFVDPVSRQRLLRPAQDYTWFAINEDRLIDQIVEGLGAILNRRSFEQIDKNLFRLGEFRENDRRIPVFLARRLGEAKVFSSHDVKLRAHHGAGAGIVVHGSDFSPWYVGPNVAVRLATVWAESDDKRGLDKAALLGRFHDKSTLVANCQMATVVRASDHNGAFIMPGKTALQLGSTPQMIFFERLAAAYNSGMGNVHSKVLVEGLNVDTPKKVFTGKMRELVFAEYVEKADAPRHWRLKG
ncbi:hypothetical protein [Pseudooceanicola sp.]|uniref:hypothetical protein n=1 Tax=Pseudooceanicola sp. TaxID=1914328 RepID=UPI0035C6A6A7